MRSTTNLLIINLAAADILFVIFCVPFTATDYVFTEWPFGDLWCKYVSYSQIKTLKPTRHHTEMKWFSSLLTGTIHDCRYMPCERLHARSDVIRSIPRRCASGNEYVAANRTQRNIVSGHFYANSHFHSLFATRFECSTMEKFASIEMTLLALQF